MGPAVSEGTTAATRDGEFIRVRGVRVHNLRNLDLDIPRDRLVVITGPSGSGKSSLAFDTLFAEGQRQYIESLSVYARQFLHQLERPDVDLIDQLQPTVSIDQQAGSQNPRSTVATVTEIYDYLRLLFARAGDAYCYRCGAAIKQQTPEQIVDTLVGLSTGTKAMLLAPLVRGRKGLHQDVLETIRKAGFNRVRVDGVVYELEAVPPLAKQRRHAIEAVVDRVVIREGVRPRVAESIQLALRHSPGLVVAAVLAPGAVKEPDAWQDLVFSTEHACPQCGLSYEELEPRTFSFNSPYGACRACDGLGSRVGFDPDLVAPDRSLSLAEGAVAPWRGATAPITARHRRELAPLLSEHGVRWKQPLEQLKPKVLDALFQGDDDSVVGVLGILDREYAGATSAAALERWERFRGVLACPECGGTRLRPEARSVKIAGRAIHEVTALTVEHAREFFSALEFPAEASAVAAPLVAQIKVRLDFLANVGLAYLTLDRAADSLSGGELQRIRLASSIGSGLVGVCYVLDEPSIGLHPRDNARLIGALRALEQQGNSVLVVEHDEAIMRAADHLIDLGPGAGVEGGRLVAQGTPAEVCRDSGSVTGRYLAGQLTIPVPRRRKVSLRRVLSIEGVTTNNLKDISVAVPLSALVCVTGVSGSGKSSLVNETLVRALVRRLSGTGLKPGPHRRLTGASQIDKLVEIDQTPIGRTPRSNPATYTGVFDEIRKVFAGTREAQVRGYKASRFSFNVKGGRCEHCQGQGLQKIEMNFLPDLYVPCPQCHGARLNRATLEVHYRGRSIAEVLAMSVEAALQFFENVPLIRRVLEALRDVGLGYLPLGQSSTTLSGGEAQRIKLATELARVDTGSTLYVLDEPTTGLHFDDIRRLLDVLGRLVDQGNTVVVIEHHLDVIKSADWIIDLGPEGGEAGGYAVATGTPEEVAALDDNHTSQYLRPVLAGIHQTNGAHDEASVTPSRQSLANRTR
ncbi:MAG: excinuclease ABC subunit UvrA [Planctomycetia bacterium]|nr:excinuclease ABC subunit UvrA [Planctomycetia bacterium]